MSCRKIESHCLSETDCDNKGNQGLGFREGKRNVAQFFEFSPATNDLACNSICTRMGEALSRATDDVDGGLCNFML